MDIDFKHSALLNVDVQNDFCPGGALGVKDGDLVIEPINRLTELLAARGSLIIATQDWHPENHASFAASHEGNNPYDKIDLGEVRNQILWPKHCVQGSRGAEFHDEMKIKPINFIIRKGFRKDLDSYSAFFENDLKTPTGLDGLLKNLSIKTVIIGGLATDYCVLYSALDSVVLGYNTIIVGDAVCGIDFPPGSVDQALKRMVTAGIIVVKSGEIQ